MEKMIDLLDLLKHHVLDLFSAEEQIIEALPAMIGKAKNPELVAALKDHLQVTKVQRTRLQEVQRMINKEEGEGEELGENKGGFFSRFFGGATEKCKAMEGLITESQKLMAEDMVPEVMDSAIIAAAQKIEHYEISGYGTARAFANELRLEEVERLLKQTLDEEYYADDSLTKLAVGKLNLLAEEGVGSTKPSKAATVESASKGSSPKAAPKKAASKTHTGLLVKPKASKVSPSKSVVIKAANKKAFPKKAARKTAAPNKATLNKVAPKKVAPKKANPIKGAAKKAVSKKAPNKAPQKAPKKTAKKGRK